MTNAERAKQLQTLAAMAQQDGQGRAAGILERAAYDIARDDVVGANGRVDMLLRASRSISSLWDAFDYAKLAVEVLS